VIQIYIGRVSCKTVVVILVLKRIRRSSICDSKIVVQKNVKGKNNDMDTNIIVWGESNIGRVSCKTVDVIFVLKGIWRSSSHDSKIEVQKNVIDKSDYFYYIFNFSSKN